MSAARLSGNRCQCAACGDLFNSASTFDRHRIGAFERLGSRRCRTEDELLARGWSKNVRGFWIERARPSEPSTIRVGSERVREAATKPAEAANDVGEQRSRQAPSLEYAGGNYE